MRDKNIMGLDITAYGQLTELDCVFDAEGEPIHPETRQPLDYDLRAYVNPDFPGREGAIKDKGVYSALAAFGFGAGGYGRYNAWRNDLAELAGYPKRPVEKYGNIQHRHDQGAWEAESGPFWELINFSDCGGVIGAEVSAKLAKDFAEHQAKADTHEIEWFRDSYSDWRKAFDLAAQDGAVHFH